MDIKTKLDKILMNLSAFSLQGERSHMEDYFDIGYQLKNDHHIKASEWPFEYVYFGIFDGHGGCDAAEYAKKHLMKNITKQSEFWSENDDDILKSIQIGYAVTHENMRKIMHEWPRSPRNHLPSTAGTTASVLFIRNGKYYLGHVGDSRIVISRRNPDTNRWISQQMTEDHKPESPTELERIQRAGGDVKSKVGVHRVVWCRPVLTPEFESPSSYYCAYNHNVQVTPYEHPKADQISRYPIHETYVKYYQTIPFLAIARSLGDFWSINSYSGQYIVSPEPDVSCRPVDANDECILLATDGLWSVMHSQLAVRALEEFKAIRDDKRQTEEYKDQYFNTDNFYNVMSRSEKDNYAISLVYMAYQMWDRRKLRPDNITAVVAMLGDIIGPLQNCAKSRNYRTRSLCKLDEQMTPNHQCTNGYIEANIKQIPYTRKYTEQLYTCQVPSLDFSPLEGADIRFFERLGNLLLIPKAYLNELSAYDQYRPKVDLIPPENYNRLEKTQDRSIRCDHGKSILVRRVTDDPSDEGLQQERPGRKSGTIVRDASAQCTQNIYDFNTMWPLEMVHQWMIHDRVDLEDEKKFYEHNEDDEDQEEEEREEDDFEEIEAFEIEDDDANEESPDDNDDIEEDKIPSLDDEDDNKILLFEHIELDLSPEHAVAGECERPTTRRTTRDLVKNSRPPEEHMLQPRSDNCDESPKYRRQTRSGAYLSMTCVPKRKILIDSPKCKRRKSHPMQCPVGQS